MYKKVLKRNAFDNHQYISRDYASGGQVLYTRLYSYTIATLYVKWLLVLQCTLSGGSGSGGNGGSGLSSCVWVWEREQRTVRQLVMVSDLQFSSTSIKLSLEVGNNYTKTVAPLIPTLTVQGTLHKPFEGSLKSQGYYPLYNNLHYITVQNIWQTYIERLE